MDFGEILRRAWDIVWNNKWLVIFGILIGLGGSTPSANTPDFNYQLDQNDFNDNGGFDFEPGENPFDDPEFREFFDETMPYAGLAGGLLIVVILVALVIGLALWFIQQIAQGGLINGVNTIDGVGTSSFGDAWRAAWQKKWQLVGVGLIPAIPGLVLAVVGIIVAVLFIGIADFSTGTFPQEMFSAAPVVTLIVVACVVGLISLVLSILYTFAVRAVMIEDEKVFDAYRRGWQVLSANFGPALLLFIVQVVLGIITAVLLFIPALCCLVWPFLWVINGSIATYFSSVWTLAWREWTGGGAIEAAPAV